MKKIFLIAAVTTALMACENKNECCGYYDTTVYISILDKDSCEMLNPGNPNGYKVTDIVLFKDSNLKEKQADVNFISFPNIYGEQDSMYYIFFNAPMDYRNGDKFCATSYLKLNDTTIDVVYTEVTESTDSQVLTKVLYNNEDITRTKTIVKK